MAEAKARLSEELKDALRAGDKVRLAALRLLSASVKNREVELRRELTDEEFVEVASREVKRRKEAAEAFEGAGRTELVDREREEQEVLEAYLPVQLGPEETEALVAEAIEATGASGPADLGKVMGYVMGKARGRVDGGAVNRLARSRLEGMGA
ncbi:MAG: GatB/YqeY domain-containing protein [Actinomycetota bacterium]